jgi:UDP-glucose 4-epimerase/dTDP-L-rhamnose 4-epimerase
MKWKNRRVLVTGGAGLVGSRIVKEVIRLGARVRVLDNLSAYPFDQKSHFGLSDLGNCEFIKGDISDSATVKAALEGVDVVFHEAAFADVAASIWNPGEDFRSNVVGTWNILESSRSIGVDRLVFASSASVYGDPPRQRNNIPVFKESQGTGPLSTYANSKLWGENEFVLFYQLYGLRTTSLRYFSIYGPPQVPKKRSQSWAIAIFTMLLAKGKPLTIFGDGSQVRDFTHVNDIAKATVRAAEMDKTVGRVINIGTGIPTSIASLAKLIIESSGREANIKYKPRPRGDPLGGYADTKLMSELLGWTPAVKLRDGIEEYWNWVQHSRTSIPTWL